MSGFRGQCFHVFNKHASSAVDEPYFRSDEVLYEWDGEHMPSVYSWRDDGIGQLVMRVTVCLGCVECKSVDCFLLCAPYHSSLGSIHDVSTAVVEQRLAPNVCSEVALQRFWLFHSAHGDFGCSYAVRPFWVLTCCSIGGNLRQRVCGR